MRKFLALFALGGGAYLIFRYLSIASERPISDGDGFGFINAAAVDFQGLNPFEEKESLSMNFSTKLLDFLKSYEGFSAVSYYATPSEKAKDIKTIGYGHVIVEGDGLSADMVINETKALGILLADIAAKQVAVNRYVKVPLTQNQFDALVSFAFNVGIGNFKGSTLLKVLNNGDYDGVPAQIMRWNKQDGRILAGLTKRRQSEVNIWNSGDYSRV